MLYISTLGPILKEAKKICQSPNVNGTFSYPSPYFKKTSNGFEPLITEQIMDLGGKLWTKFLK